MTLVRCMVIAGCLGLLGGCSGKPRGQVPPEALLLQQVNDLFRTASGRTGQSPTQLSDLDRSQALFPRAYAAVQSGEIVVLWGAALKGESEVGKNESVVAYEKNAPTSGGYVLLSAGTVKKMSAAELSAALKGR
jgi:hypothetical protein